MQVQLTLDWCAVIAWVWFWSERWSHSWRKTAHRRSNTTSRTRKRVTVLCQQHGFWIQFGVTQVSLHTTGILLFGSFAWPKDSAEKEWPSDDWLSHPQEMAQEEARGARSSAHHHSWIKDQFLWKRNSYNEYNTNSLNLPCIWGVWVLNAEACVLLWLWNQCVVEACFRTSACHPPCPGVTTLQRRSHDGCVNRTPPLAANSQL